MDLMQEVFPALSKYRAYLNTASTGLLPRRVKERVEELLADLQVYETGTSLEEYYEAYFDPFLREAAKLMRVSKEEITITLQTTEGLKRALYALPSEGKGRKIVSFDLEFPTIGTLLRSMERRGYSLEIVENVDGKYEEGEIEKKAKGAFAMVFSSAEWINGYTFDPKLIKEIHEENGTIIIIDAVQHLGASRMFPKDYGADVVVAGGEKWLLNPYIGSGVMYVSKEFSEEHSPPLLGLLNMNPPGGSWHSWWSDPNKDPFGEFSPAPGAKKFDPGGGLPIILACCIGEAISLINSIGIEKIEEKNRRMKRKIVDYAYEAGLKISGLVSDEKRWVPIVTVETGLSYDSEKEVYEGLSKKRIVVSHRGCKGIRGIRFSPHFYNSEEEVEVAFEEFLQEIQRVKRGTLTFATFRQT